MKRDYIYLLIVAIVVIVTSCAVEEPRLMTPEKEPILERAAAGIVKEIETAKYIALITPRPDEEPEIEEVIEQAPEEPLSTPVENIEESVDVIEDAEEEIVNPVVTYDSPGLVYLGEYEITAYEYTGSTCANGNYPTPWYTVACNSLPFGTELYIDGVGYVIVEDRGADWHSSNWLDLYIGDIDACYEWGVQYRDVYLVE